MSINARYTK